MADGIILDIQNGHWHSRGTQTSATAHGVCLLLWGALRFAARLTRTRGGAAAVEYIYESSPQNDRICVRAVSERGECGAGGGGVSLSGGEAPERRTAVCS